MPNYWPSWSILRWMSVVRNREIRNMVLLMQYFRFTVDMFLYKFDVCMIGKTTVLVICIHKCVKSIDLAVSIKFFDESVLAILSLFWFKQTFLIKEIWNILYRGNYICLLGPYNIKIKIIYIYMQNINTIKTDIGIWV